MKTFLSQFSPYDGCLPAGLILPEVKIDPKYYAQLKISETSTNFEFLSSLCHSAINKMSFPSEEKKAEYDKRLKDELALFYELGFTDYVLIIWDILNFCHEKNIPTGLGRGCLHPDSNIQSKEGAKKLSEICANDYIINSLGNFDKVSAVYKYPCSEPLVTFKTMCDTFTTVSMTKDHEVFCLKNPFKRNSAGYVTKLSKRYSLKDIFQKSNLCWKRADEINKDDYLCRYVGRSIPEKDIKFIDLSIFSDDYDDDFVYENHSINNHPLCINTISKNSGISEHCLRSIKKQESTVREYSIIRLKKYLSPMGYSIHDFCQFKPCITKKYKRYLKVDEDFCYVLGFFAGDGWRGRDTAIGFAFDCDSNKNELSKIKQYFLNLDFDIYEHKHKTKNLIQLCINSKLAVNLFTSLIFGKTKDKYIPEEYLALPDNKLESILRGLLESDGHEDGYVISFDNTSLRLIYQVRWLLEYFGYGCNISTRFQEGCNQSYKIKTRKKSIQNTCYFNDGKYLYIKVTGKSNIFNESKVVYDITVEDNPSYSTDKYIVHNSAAGSLVLYLIGVTGIDPVKYNLYFERFVSKARARQFTENGIKYLDGSYLADCDSDISYDRRQEVIDYIYSKYPGYVSSISTFATLSGKLCIKECSKIVEESSEEEAQHTADSIPKIFGKVMGLKKATKESEKFGKWAEKHKRVFDISKHLEGLIKNTSVHPSGIAIGSKKIDELCPISFDESKRPVAGYEMDTISNLMIKVDVLGLRTLSVVDDCCKRIGIDWKTIDVNHPSIYTALQNLECPKGIFQIEADATFNVCKKIKPSNIQELSDVIAISRPGAMAFVDEYVDIKNGNKVLPERNPILDSILKETKGIIIYQEGIMKIAHEVFGFSLQDADTLRKIVGKKKKKEVKKWQSKIEVQAKSIGVDKSIVDFFWKSLNDSADYLFCRSHSIAYSCLAGICVYLKFNHPKEFFISLLKMSQFEPKPQEEIRIISNELSRFGIKLLPPDLAASGMDFTIEGNDIRYGLSSIKGVSDKTLESLATFRSSQKPNKFEIFIAANEAGLNIGVLSSLIQAGTLGGYRQKRSRMVLEAQCFNLLTDREKRNILPLGEKYEFDLLQLIKDAHDNKFVADDQKILIKDSRFETIKRNLEKYKQIYEKNSKYENFANWYFEKQLLGYSPNLKLKNIMGEEYRDSEDIPQMAKWSKNKLIGTVESSKKAKSASGNSYILLNMFDDSGSFKAILCDNQRFKKCTEYLEANKPIPEKDDIVVIIGSPSDDGTIFIEDMSIMSEKIYLKLKDLD